MVVICLIMDLRKLLVILGRFRLDCVHITGIVLFEIRRSKTVIDG